MGKKKPEPKLAEPDLPPVRINGRRQTGPQLFQQRLLIEKRVQERKQLVQSLVDGGMSLDDAQVKAREKMGYKGERHEIELYYQRVKASLSPPSEKDADLQVDLTPAERSRLDQELATRSKQKLQETTRNQYKAFVAKLPDTVPHKTELEWIRLHPALTRKNVGKNTITLADIKNAPHGPAPSKRAVNDLRYHANNPKEFYREILKKQFDIDEEDSVKEKEELLLDDIGEAEKMLKEATKGMSLICPKCGIHILEHTTKDTESNRVGRMAEAQA